MSDARQQAEDHYYAALDLMAEGQLEQAVARYREALLSDPTSFHANLRMGWNCGHLGRYEDARRHIARAIRHGRMSAAGLSACGGTGRPFKALSCEE